MIAVLKTVIGGSDIELGLCKASSNDMKDRLLKQRTICDASSTSKECENSTSLSD